MRAMTEWRRRLPTAANSRAVIGLGRTHRSTSRHDEANASGGLGT